MRHSLLCLLRSLFTLSLVSVYLAAPGGADTPKVISLKGFLKCQTWQLDVTYSARDSYEDNDFILQLEMKAVARYYLERLDRGEASGHWQALECKSFNHSWNGLRQSKTSSSRTEYHQKGGASMVAPLADLVIGAGTPGYLLIVNGGFPGEMRDSTMGLVDHPLVIGSSIKDMPGLEGVVSGPLPESGLTISGSRVIPFDVPPFLKDCPRTTRMGIEYVLKPDDRLAPLVPPKKKP